MSAREMGETFTGWKVSHIASVEGLGSRRLKEGCMGDHSVPLRCTSWSSTFM